MNCKDVIPLLSSFHDGELPPENQQVVAQHVTTCAACSARLESLRRLADLVELTPVPETPTTLAARVEQSLHEPAPMTARLQSGRSRWTTAVALASLVAVLVTGLTIWQLTTGSRHGHFEMARAFGEFLDAYEQGEKNAVEVLPGKYHGTLVDEAAATIALKRPTVARSIVLANHQATKRYLLKMPCCDCIETVYSCDGSTSLVLFEHEQEQTEWFDNRPMIRSECQGKACCTVQLKNGIAATWPVDGGFVTVVGVQDLVELGSLVAELERSGD